jgi:probable rRNA maturation factor
MPLLVTLTNASASRYTGRASIISRAEKALRGEGVKSGQVDIILVDDKFLRQLHKKWLGKNTSTDVITFPLAEDPPIHGEVYISIDTARKQAIEYDVSLKNELCRLSVHGALHLAGYDDATKAERDRMHELENKYISGL